MCIASISRPPTVQPQVMTIPSPTPTQTLPISTQVSLSFITGAEGTGMKAVVRENTAVKARVRKKKLRPRPLKVIMNMGMLNA